MAACFNLFNQRPFPSIFRRFGKELSSRGACVDQASVDKMSEDFKSLQVIWPLAVAETNNNIESPDYSLDLVNENDVRSNNSNKPHLPPELFLFIFKDLLQSRSRRTFLNLLLSCKLLFELGLPMHLTILPIEFASLLWEKYGGIERLRVLQGGMQGMVVPESLLSGRNKANAVAILSSPRRKLAKLEQLDMILRHPEDPSVLFNLLCQLDGKMTTLNLVKLQLGSPALEKFAILPSLPSSAPNILHLEIGLIDRWSEWRLSDVLRCLAPKTWTLTMPMRQGCAQAVKNYPGLVSAVVDVEDFNGCGCLKQGGVEVGEVKVVGKFGTVLWAVGIRAQIGTLRLPEPFMLGRLSVLLGQLKDPSGNWLVKKVVVEKPKGGYRGSIVCCTGVDIEIWGKSWMKEEKEVVDMEQRKMWEAMEGVVWRMDR